MVVGIVSYLLLANSAGNCPQCGKYVSQQYIQKLSQVANNYTLADQIGPGVVQLSGLYSNLPKEINQPPLSFGGKPGILYVGGEFCPYCAVSRWGLIIALMRFGNFSSFTYMKSSSKDVYADTPTFSFSNYSYSSSLVHFTAFEIYDRSEKNITNPNFTPSEEALYSKYAGGIPFIDFENQSYISGASVSPQLLDGSNWNQILANLTKQNSVQAQAIIGNANLYTAYICKSNQTLNSTAVACKQSYIKSIIG